jgi:hypothetical protein
MRVSSLWVSISTVGAALNRLLHVPARLTHGARKRRLRLPSTWPWAAAIVTAFNKIAAIPAPD